MADAAAGSINASTGVFTAGHTAGSYSGAILAASGGVTGTASVTVTPGPLHHIAIIPAQPTVVVTWEQTFTAQGYDQYGNQRTGDAFTWSVAETAAGSINANTGVFTAGTVPGTYTNVIQAASGGITGTASVDIIGGIIEGTVVLQGSLRPAAGRVVPLTVKLFNPGANVMSDTPLAAYFSYTAQTGTNNVTFQIDGVIPGTYDISVVSQHTLLNVKRGVAVNFLSVTVNFGTLLEGNSNNDRQVTIVDFTTLVASYGKSTGESGFDARADFDRNNRVDITDFTMLAANYQKSSPREVVSP